MDLTPDQKRIVQNMLASTMRDENAQNAMASMFPPDMFDGWDRDQLKGLVDQCDSMLKDLWCAPAPEVDPAKVFNHGRRLEAGEIRLLYLQPGNPVDDLRGRLDIEKINEATYSALSYTWGHPVLPDSLDAAIIESNDPNFKELRPEEDRRWSIPDRSAHYLWIGDHAIRTSANLFSALRHLRDPKEELVLWVDALSINQQDDEEKSSQISIMSNIYRRATSVLIWLGPSVPGSDEALEAIQSLSRSAQQYREWFIDFLPNITGPKHLNTQEDRDQLVAASFATALGHQVKSDVDIPAFPFDAIDGLLCRKWWSRGWVLQELVCAWKVSFVCGWKRTEADAENSILIFLNHYSAVESQLSSPRLTNFFPPYMMLKVRDQYRSIMWQQAIEHNVTSGRRQIKAKRDDSSLQHHNQYVPLQWLLQLSNSVGLETAQEVDRIYSLLGIASDSKAMSITISYATSFHKLYTQLAVEYLKQGKLWFLSYCHRDDLKRSTDTLLPSWVPNWTIKQNKCILRELDGANGTFCASASTKATFNYIETGNGMQVQLRGSIIEGIEAVSDASPHSRFTSATTDDEIRLAFLFWMRKVAVLMFKDGRAGLSRSFIAGVGPPKQTKREDRTALASDTLLDMYGDYLSRGTEFEDDLNRATKEAEELLAATASAEHHKQEYMEEQYLNAVYSSTESRSIFRTKSGRAGLGPAQSRKDDVVVIFHGANVPYIVRPTLDSSGRSCYILVGEAYLDGVMYGENFQNYEAVDITLI